MGNSKNLEHAQHNEKACKYLNIKSDYLDWVITTAFYSALHYVRHKLIPVTVILNGKNVTFNDFENYFRYNNPLSISKHEFLESKVNEKMPEIGPHYSYLMNTCKNARYINYKFGRKESGQAVAYLKLIKEACTTK